MSKKQTILKKLVSWGLFENVVKFVQNIENQKNIKIKNYQQIIIGLDEKSLPLLKKIFPDFNLVRDDLLLPEAVATNPKPIDETNLEAFKGYIFDEHYRALLASATIARLEDEGHIEDAIRLKKNLLEIYGEEGRRIYNLYRSNFIEKWFYWDLVWIRYQAPTDETAREKYKKQFAQVLTFSRNAIWVNEEVTHEEILDRLYDRFHEHGVAKVYIHAKRKENIEKIIDCCGQYIEQDDFDYETKDEKYTIANLPCLRIAMRRLSLIKYKKGVWHKEKIKRKKKRKKT